MSTVNSISIQIPEADLQAVRDALATIQTTLSPYLQALSPEERKTLLKMSDRSEPFVSKVMDYVGSSPQFLPPFVIVQELQNDWNAVQHLIPLVRSVSQLQSNLSDTLMLAGSESYVTALSYYNSVKLAAKMNVADAKVIYDDLRKRFQRSGKVQTDPVV
jgi:hypothetical protein